MNFLVLGILIGLIMSAINRVYSLKEIIGFSILAVAGVFYGNLLALVLEESLNQTFPFFHPILLFIGGLGLPSLKVLFLTRSRHLKDFTNRHPVSLS